MGESSVCLDEPGSLWAAEKIQRGGERVREAWRGRGKGGIERYQERREIGVVKVCVCVCKMA